MIPSLETRWQGYRFRSRTEARWAVFFTELGAHFEYELERFALPSGQYLPDFYLPKAKVWAEVKGEGFSTREEHLCAELAALTRRPCLLLPGAPDFTEYGVVFPSGKRARLRLTLERHERAVKASRFARFEGKQKGVRHAA